MKKFSSVLAIFFLIITLCFAGCTYADNATLMSIQEKYRFISTKNQEFYNANSFVVSYNSDKLNLVINSSNEQFKVLKTDNSISNYLNRGEYGILMQGLNSTYLTNSLAFQSEDNNSKTEKKFKVNMYKALDNLQKNLKALKSSKASLESVFNNDSRDSLVISKAALTLNNLNKYKQNLNKCLKDIYNFNKNYNLALNNNISSPIALEDLLYNLTNIDDLYLIMNEYNNKMINNCNLLIGNFVLSYGIGLNSNVSINKTLTDNMAKLLNVQYIILQDNYTLPSDEAKKQEIVDNYKVLRALEISLINLETSFDNACKILDFESLDKPNEKQKISIELIKNYENQLVNYSNRLVDYISELIPSS